MTNEDPFQIPADGGPTVVRPMPGGRRPPGAPPAPLPPHPPGAGPVWNAPLPSATGDNPLVACATDLLTVAGQLRGSSHHPDPDGLREQLTRQMREFEQCARAKGLTDPVVLPARYVLCALVDESVLDTPWGSQSVWAKRGLLISFHNETWGGEKFYQLLDRLLQEPAKNLHLLELMYLCLSLGFEGKFRVQDQGRAVLEGIKDNLYQTIRMHRGDFERSLSPRWRGVEDKRTPLAKYVPLWVVAAVSAGLLMVAYWGFLMAINSSSNPAVAEMAALGRNVPPLVRDRVYQAPIRQEAGLRDYLQNEISAGLVDVKDVQQGEVVVIGGDGLFGSGSAEVRTDSVPVLLAIAGALNKVPGRVMITGHTDSIPIRSIRYPSNWHLSEARANAVRQLLTTQVAADRLSAEGLADTRPVVPNDTAANRAQNRRVEIMLLTAGRL